MIWKKRQIENLLYLKRSKAEHCSQLPLHSKGNSEHLTRYSICKFFVKIILQFSSTNVNYLVLLSTTPT